ncbi:MAG: M20/M25/M40 family metallo-hydrolase [Bacteroidia bacterium]|nr:M20/M25/M40 family metallo-hydrolase [Bacteroidia bacterium]
MRRLLRLTLIAIGLIFCTTLFIALSRKSSQKPVQWLGTAVADTAAFLRLAESLQFRTESQDGTGSNYKRDSAMQLLHEWLRDKYPLIHSRAMVHYFGKGSVLFTLHGKNPKLQPCMFSAHLDVVPVLPKEALMWRFRPYDGIIHKDTLWGRGSQDDKFSVLAILEAVESMLKSDRLPQHTILLAFGHDEETGGHEGAAEIAKWLEKQNIQPAFISDEGLGLTQGIVPGIQKPVALIGISEKGFLSLRLEIRTGGGHSSMPKANNACKRLTQALNRIENYRFPARLDGPMHGFFQNAAPEMSGLYRYIFSNLWLTSPLVKWQLSQNEKTDASIRTSHVTTMLFAGDKENVVPAMAWAVVNFRILPGDSIHGIMHKINTLINDTAIHISIYNDHNEAAPVSPHDGWAWDCMETAIKQTYQDAVVLPGLMIGGTDSKNYTRICKNIYRFAPLRIQGNSTDGIHGINERLPMTEYAEAIAFYRNFISQL